MDTTYTSQPPLTAPVTPEPGSDTSTVAPRSGGSRRRSGTQSSTTNRPPGSRWRAALAKQATCWSWVVRFEIVLKTRYTSAYVRPRSKSLMSPTEAPTDPPRGWARSSSIALTE